MLYEKFSDEFKDRLITVRKAENLNDLILLLSDMDANMKKISKQFQLRIKPNTSSFLAIKPLFRSYNSTPTKPSTTVGVAVVFLISSTATGTYLGPMDVSNAIRRGPISQEEKNSYNSPGLCRYYG